jgi:tRNA nucleotidyltransferase (CCA-adding enzyme)
LAEAIAAAGGRALVVGGWPRDRLLGRPSKDLDLEVFGLDPDRLAAILADLGAKAPVGRRFPVWRFGRAGVDVAHPREGALDYHPDRPDSLEAAFRLAARHRDLTINALAWDPLGGRWIDPFGGRADLAARRLRLVDRETFVEDPLRLLRVARFTACLEAEPDTELLGICREMAFEDVPPERVAEELRRLLRGADRPSRGFELLVEVDRLAVLPPIDALRGVPQDPLWHPEGDVFVHTMRVIDCAAGLARSLSGEEGEVLLWAALCHDLGKPETTTTAGDGRIRSLRHEQVGARITREWLAWLRLPRRRVRAVEALVRHHLAPSQLVSGGAGPRAYRRLARRLAEAGLTLVDLERLARADHLGRTTEAARRGVYEAGPRFLAAARAAGVESGPRPDVVSARRLMSAGVSEGEGLGWAIARCRTLEDERDDPDPDAIVAIATRELRERDSRGGPADGPRSSGPSEAKPEPTPKRKPKSTRGH